jgi:hypothetical protein
LLKNTGAHRFWEALAGQRHLPGVRGEGAVEDFAVLKGDELSRRDRQTTRLPLSIMSSLTIRLMSANGKGIQ